MRVGTNAVDHQRAEWEFLQLVMEPASTLPDDDESVYTSSYCEENIYRLVKRFSSSPGDEPERGIFAVFISNPTRTVALWSQRMAPARDTPIVWDYHVVLALREPQSRVLSQVADERGTWIYDLDTRLPVPCYWKTYVAQTFPLGVDTPPQYQSLFRVIPGNVYLNNFASDRSHMLDIPASNASEEPQYLSEPPPYAAICGPEAKKRGVVHNLMTHFVSMAGDEQGFGAVMDFDGFTAWCCLPDGRVPEGVM